MGQRIPLPAPCSRAKGRRGGRPRKDADWTAGARSDGREGQAKGRREQRVGNLLSVLASRTRRRHLRRYDHMPAKKRRLRAGPWRRTGFHDQRGQIVRPSDDVTVQGPAKGKRQQKTFVAIDRECAAHDRAWAVGRSGNVFGRNKKERKYFERGADQHVRRQPTRSTSLPRQPIGIQSEMELSGNGPTVTGETRDQSDWPG